MSSDGLSKSSGGAQLIMKNVSILSELSSQLKKETERSESCLSSLDSLIYQAGKDVSCLHHCVNSLLSISKTLVHTSIQLVSEDDLNFKSLKSEADNLLKVLEEIQHRGTGNDDESNEAKWRQSVRNVKENPSCKSLIIDEKYPDHCSKESLLDMNGIGSLPTVHEDVFADFNRPSRTISSSSLKNLRKVKMCLQKVTDADDWGIAESGKDKSDTKDCHTSPVGLNYNVVRSTLPLRRIRDEANQIKRKTN